MNRLAQSLHASSRMVAASKKYFSPVSSARRFITSEPGKCENITNFYSASIFNAYNNLHFVYYILITPFPVAVKPKAVSNPERSVYHEGAATVANIQLNGTTRRFYKNVTITEEGNGMLYPSIQQYSDAF